MTLVDFRFLIYFIIALESSLLAFLFYKTRDGTVRKLLIVKNIVISIFFISAIIRGTMDIGGNELIGNCIITITGMLLAISQSMLVYYLIKPRGKDELF